MEIERGGHFDSRNRECAPHSIEIKLIIGRIDQGEGKGRIRINPGQCAGESEPNGVHWNRHGGNGSRQHIVVRALNLKRGRHLSQRRKLIQGCTELARAEVGDSLRARCVKKTEHEQKAEAKCFHRKKKQYGWAKGDFV